MSMASQSFARMNIRLAEIVFAVLFVYPRVVLVYLLALTRESEDFISRYACMPSDGMIIGRVEHQQIHDLVHRTT